MGHAERGSRSDDDATSRESRRAAALEELTSLVLDQLGPVVVGYRREVARRVGLRPDEVTCLDLLRRLEIGGHVERSVDGPQDIDVRWRPHPERDAVLDALRARIRRDLDDLVATHRLDDPDRLALVAGSIAGIQNALFRRTQELTDAVREATILEQRRRGREAMPIRW